MAQSTSDDTDGVGMPIAPLLDDLLRGAPAWREPEETAPDSAALVAYLTGALSTAEASRTERALTFHPAARRRLRTIAARLDALQAAPWAEVEAAAVGDDVARAWRDLAEARLAQAPAARSHWAAGWEAVRAAADAGAAEAQAAWTAFLSFADGWERQRRVLRLAGARGAAPTVSGPVPLGIRLITETGIDDAGALTARMRAEDTAGEPSDALDGTTVGLALATDGDTWPLTGGTVRGGEAAWRLPGVGLALGLPAGPLSGLIVTVGDAAFAVEDSEAVRRLPVGVHGAEVDLWGPPHRKEGRLRLRLALPALTRAMQPGSQLVLSAAVGPGLTQRLGAWPVSDWAGSGDDPREVDADCPGPDGDFDAASLRLDLE